MTGMERTIEQAAQVIAEAYRKGGDIWGDDLARALADAGLLAPAPLRETRCRGTLWGTMLHPYDGSDENEYVSYATGWMPVDRVEGGGRAEP